MSPIFPPSLLFQFLTSIQRNESLPRSRGSLLSLSEEHIIFAPSRLNAMELEQSGVPAGIEVRVGWNPRGIGIAVEVRGKKHSPEGRRGDLRNSDFVRLMIDTRHTANVHRMTSYCHSYLILPMDTTAKNVPTISHSDAGMTGLGIRSGLTDIQLKYQSRPDGYLLETWIPESSLYGFAEAVDIRRIGFYGLVHDTELGEIPLNVGDDFPVTIDPSQWMAMELVD